MTHTCVEVLFPRNPMGGVATVVAWFPPDLVHQFDGEKFEAIIRRHPHNLPKFNLICNFKATRLSIAYTVVAQSGGAAECAAAYLERLIRSTGLPVVKKSCTTAHIKKLLAE